MSVVVGFALVVRFLRVVVLVFLVEVFLFLVGFDSLTFSTSCLFYQAFYILKELSSSCPLLILYHYAFLVIVTDLETASAVSGASSEPSGVNVTVYV